MERLTKVSAVGEHLPRKPLNLIHKSDSSESNLTEILEKLGEYEDAEEQGLLLRLPCGIGTDIYYIPSEENFRLNLLDGHGEENRVFHQTVDRITFRKNERMGNK